MVSVQAEEELGALKEIYGDELERVSTSQIAIRIGDQARMVVNLPEGYPIQDAPILELRNWPDKEAVETMHGELMEMFMAPDVVLFTWIEHLRSSLPETQQEQEQEEPKVVAVAVQHEEEQHEVEFDVEIVSGESMTVRKSTFQAHLAKVTSAEQVNYVLRTLKLNNKIAKATHNMVAYRIERAPNLFLCDNDDDGEDNAGSRLAHLLEIVDAKNVVVVVSRWYGGIKLGPSRFKYINNVARDLLQQQGLCI